MKAVRMKRLAWVALLPLIAMAVQEPTLTYKDPQTGKPFTKAEFVRFGESYLGADIIFWSTTSPWLKAK